MQCSEGYYLIAQGCVQCPSICQTCIAQSCTSYKVGTGIIASNLNAVLIAAVCDPGCLSCNIYTPSVCNVCFPGLYLYNSTFCIPCTNSHCKTCSASNPSQCLSCFSRSYLSNGNCLQCQTSSNCIFCNSSSLSQCLSCPFGYTMNALYQTCDI